jgi:hypothetical protein
LMADLFREKKYCWLAVDKSLRWNNDWHIPHPWIQAMCGDVQRPTDNERAAVIPRRFVCWCLADTFRSSLPTHLLLLLLGIHQHRRIFRYSPRDSSTQTNFQIQQGQGRRWFFFSHLASLWDCSAVVSRLVFTYLLAQNTIHSTSRTPSLSLDSLDPSRFLR